MEDTQSVLEEHTGFGKEKCEENKMFKKGAESVEVAGNRRLREVQSQRRRRESSLGQGANEKN